MADHGGDNLCPSELKEKGRISIVSYVQGFPKKTPVYHKSKIFLIYSVMMKKVIYNVTYQF